jgi:hypothetical protein
VIAETVKPYEGLTEEEIKRKKVRDADFWKAFYNGKNSPAGAQEFANYAAQEGNILGLVGNFTGDLARPYTTDWQRTAIETGVNFASGAVGLLAGGYIKRKVATEVADEAAGAAAGEFSVTRWNGYPSNVPKPNGSVRKLSGEEYRKARAAADAANRRLHKTNPALDGKQIHEIKPVKFNGSPSDPANKIPVDGSTHHELNRFWNDLQRYLLDK